MLLAVQKGNLELSVTTALKHLNEHRSVHSGAGFEAGGVESIVRKCLFAFPYLWIDRPDDAGALLCSMLLLTTPVVALQFDVSSCGASLRLKPSDDGYPRLSSSLSTTAVLGPPGRSLQLDFMSGCGASLRLKPSDDAYPRLSREDLLTTPVLGSPDTCSRCIPEFFTMRTLLSSLLIVLSGTSLSCHYWILGIPLYLS
ncbi:hypothetical protein EDB86DRAFT_2834111 [Lactarius hatsudake]|nr:hypothetical protein EDB86DRAFT_2834111 [Lactarius hatsudake]